MAEDTSDIIITDNKEKHRYELKFGDSDALAILVYKEQGDTITLIHTEVPQELEGHGLGGKIAKYALDDAEKRGLQVVASCPFVSSYIRRHPDYMELLTEPEKERLSKKS
ncbi:MAG: N-acetyltransferase [Chloroflexi bacterium]|nr:N-acetyltransferase [Chloroflexota bacterium]OJW02098.1 MAG: hypothetical protein BGO39_27840 [Chloroflexi bacterium 54-19]